MRALYKINEEMQKAMEIDIELIDENGEIPIAAVIASNQAIKSLEIERSEKLINTALYIKNLQAEKQARKDAIDYQKAEISKLDKQIETNHNRLANDIKHDEVIAGIDCRIKWSKSVRTEVDDEAIADLPEEYQRIIHKVEADLPLLKYAIKNGAVIKGAYNVDHWKLKIE